MGGGGGAGGQTCQTCAKPFPLQIFDVAHSPFSAVAGLSFQSCCDATRLIVGKCSSPLRLSLQKVKQEACKKPGGQCHDVARLACVFWEGCANNVARSKPEGCRIRTRVCDAQGEMPRNISRSCMTSTMCGVSFVDIFTMRTRLLSGYFRRRRGGGGKTADRCGHPSPSVKGRGRPS